MLFVIGGRVPSDSFRFQQVHVCGRFRPLRNCCDTPLRHCKCYPPFEVVSQLFVGISYVHRKDIEGCNPLSTENTWCFEFYKTGQEVWIFFCNIILYRIVVHILGEEDRHWTIFFLAFVAYETLHISKPFGKCSVLHGRLLSSHSVVGRDFCVSTHLNPKPWNHYSVCTFFSVVFGRDVSCDE